MSLPSALLAIISGEISPVAVPVTLFVKEQLENDKIITIAKLKANLKMLVRVLNGFRGVDCIIIGLVHYSKYVFKIFSRSEIIILC